VRKSATLQQDDTWRKNRRLRLHHACIAKVAEMKNFRPKFFLKNFRPNFEQDRHNSAGIAIQAEVS
jgi:hypothetical protein